MTAIAHFYGGPWDGRVQALDSTPHRLIVPVLGEVHLTSSGVNETVASAELHYVRRGPVLAGHCYYDVDPRTIPGVNL